MNEPDIYKTPTTPAEKAAERLKMADVYEGYADTLAGNGCFTKQWLYYRALAAKCRGFEFTAEQAAAEMVAHGVIKP